MAAVLASLRRAGRKRIRDEMLPRYGIDTPKAFGAPVAAMRKLAKTLGRDHELAQALWDTGWYDARIVAAFVDDPARVTSSQMDRWCRDFDNWGICDTVCFSLFDRTPHAFAKVAQWSRFKKEFGKRAAFALLASLALHDKNADDALFAKCLPLAERAATDPRNFVKKGVSWALRSIGHRCAALHAAALAAADRLIASGDATARWVGKDVRRDLDRPLVRRRL